MSEVVTVIEYPPVGLTALEVNTTVFALSVGPSLHKLKGNELGVAVTPDGVLIVTVTGEPSLASQLLPIPVGII
jgi:hypothetical protein